MNIFKVWRIKSIFKYFEREKICKNEIKDFFVFLQIYQSDFLCFFRFREKEYITMYR